MPDLRMQQRIRDLTRKLHIDDALLVYRVNAALGEVALIDVSRTIFAASAGYSAAHGLQPEQIVGRSAAPMATDDAEKLWRHAFEAGFYRHEVASVTALAYAHALAGGQHARPTKVFWTSLQLADGDVVRLCERATLSCERFRQELDANGSIRIVTLDELVR